VGLLEVEVVGGVGLLRLNDPGRRNALSAPLVGEIVAAVAELDARIVLLKHNQQELVGGGDIRAYNANVPVINGLIARSPLPTIAAVNGAAVGAGMNLALGCDVRLAGRSGRFDTRFLQLGLHPGGGHTWMLQRIAGAQAAAAALLFGEVLDGEAAERAGLVWRCVDDDDLLEGALAMARRCAEGPHELARRIKATLRRQAAVSTSADAVEVELGEQLWSLDQPEFAERLAALRRRVTS